VANTFGHTERDTQSLWRRDDPGQSHEAIDTVKQEKSTIIPAGKPESVRQGWHSSNPAEPTSDAWVFGGRPSVALDSCIHAGMTRF
jgi:hypothetical protein